MRTILVTGGAGYIGSHTVRELIKQGYNPIVFDSLENGFEDAIGSARLHKGDLRNLEDLERVFANNTIEAVVHFAAYASVPDSVDHPDKYYHNNIVGGLNLLNTMNKYGVKRIIFSSSAAVYGEPQSEVIKEDHPKNPTNPYGHTKLLFEQILHRYHVAYGINSISYRYFCAAGSSHDASIGERHEPETHVIPCCILTALGIRNSFSIYGDDFPTPDGTGIRDFIHVEDLASAHVLGLSKLEQPICEQFNLGIGKGFSVKQIIDSAKKVSGVDFPVQIVARRKGDPSMLIADPNKAMNFLGRQPKYTEIDDIVGTAFQFLKKYHAH